MNLPHNEPPELQLDLLDAVEVADALPGSPTATNTSAMPSLMVALTSLYIDSNNPRTDVPEAELEELAEDIRQHGILQPIVVHPADAGGRHQIHFGAKRWRAAQRTALREVPVVVRDAPADSYTQVAENQKRHGLSPLDLARFIRKKVEAGDSNVTVAKRLGMNLTTVAHHLTLLDLPPELDEALKSGRCISPRTLHELSKLHDEQPEHARALVSGAGEITRAAVAAMRAAPTEGIADAPAVSPSAQLMARANTACDRLERALARIKPPITYGVAPAQLVALRVRVEDLTSRWLQGSDRQTPGAGHRLNKSGR